MNATFTKIIKTLIVGFDWAMGKKAPDDRLSLGVWSLHDDRKSQPLGLCPSCWIMQMKIPSLVYCLNVNHRTTFLFGFQSNAVSFLILLTFAPSPVVSSGTFNLSVLITPLFCKSERQCTALLNGIGQQGGKIIVHKNNRLHLDCITVLHKLLLLQMQARSNRSLKGKHLTDYIP